jgi:THO complex subunit 2
MCALQAEDQRRSISEAVLQHCVMPRVTTTPEDSLFCATFFHKLHALETPNFSSLQYYDRVVKDVFPVVYCATDREARCLGVFLRATFEPLKRWRFDKRLYDKEAASKPGFSVAIGSPARCSYDQYCTVFFKWYDKITKIALHCLDQYKDHGRACLLVLIKLVGIYPVRKRVNTQLMDKLDAIKKQEDMKDLQAMAQRYHTLLNKLKDTLFEECPTKRDLPSNKPLSSVLPSKRQAISAPKVVTKEPQNKVLGKGRASCATVHISEIDHCSTKANAITKPVTTARPLLSSKGSVVKCEHSSNTATLTSSHKRDDAASGSKSVSSGAAVETPTSELRLKANESCANETQAHSQVRSVISSNINCRGRRDSDIPAPAIQRNNRSDTTLHVRECSTDRPKQADIIEGKLPSPSLVKPNTARRYDPPSKRPRSNERDRSKRSREEEKRRTGGRR